MDKDRMKCLVQDSQAVSVRFPRIMIAAEKSGGGKTLFTCALLSLLKERVQAVRAFKWGPDYIDPMFHGRCWRSRREIWTAFLRTGIR